MMGTRWKKLGRDLWTEKWRVLLMVTAIAVSLMGVGAVLGGYAILTREVPRNYLGTHPASAALELETGVETGLVEEVRRRPGIADAQAGEIVLARAKVGEDWIAMLLFVIDDFDGMRLNTFAHQSGAWPPPQGTMLIERSAQRMLEATEGGAVVVKTPHGRAREVKVTGVVHDPGLAPAWQEREGYGYVTRATLAELGEPTQLGELRISVRDSPFDAKAIEATVAELSRWLGERGHRVLQARVPPPGRHPHQTQMLGVLFLMLSFSAMALALSAILVATSIAALLARQVREIGVMKTIGARSGQIAGLYAVLIAVVGAVAVAVALPLGIAGARGLSTMVAGMLNLELESQAIPWWVLAVQAAAGLLVPLVVAAIPIARGSRITVREAIDQHGAVPPGRPRPWLLGLSRFASRDVVLAVRNAFRRRARFVLTLSLLAAGGAMFMSALNVSQGWERIVSRVYENRSYDVEIRLDAPAGVAERLGQLEGVRTVEAWGYHRTALWQPDRVDVVRTYPDGSHGSFALMGPPPATELVRFPLLSGRWLRAGDTEGVVLNHMVLAQAPDTTVGDWITLSFEGRPTRWRVVGIVEEVGSPAVAYVTDEAYTRVTGGAQRGSVAPNLPGEGCWVEVEARGGSVVRATRLTSNEEIGPADQPGGDRCGSSPLSGRVRLLRLATSAGSPKARAGVIRAIEGALEQEGASIEAVIPLAMLRTAMGDHVAVLVRMLLAMAALMVVVGMLGLGSTMGTSVLERTREIGVMKTIGATPGRIARLVVGEALVIGVSSWVVATALAVPLTALVGKTVGMLSFRVRLPMVMDPAAVASWLVLVVVVAVVATLLPARRASRLTVWETLGQV